MLGLFVAAVIAPSLPAVAGAPATHTVCSVGCDFASIQGAVNGAADGDTIQILVASTHTENDIVVNKSLAIEGLGDTTTIVQAAATPGTAAARVFFVVDALDVRFKDLTIRHGVAVGAGGGVHNQGSDLTFENVIVQDNQATDGGGIYSAGGTLTLTNVGILDNSATGGGGGGVFNAGSLIADDSEVAGNEGMDDGGGIYNLGFAVIRRSTISANTVPDSASEPQTGGGIYSEGTLSVIDSTVNQNDVGDGDGFGGGGGIFFDGTNFELLRSEVRANDAVGISEFGGVHVGGGVAMIVESVIADNSAGGGGGGGGGLLSRADGLTVVDSRISGNDGYFGGVGIVGPADIRHTTIDDNEGTLGGGVFAQSQQGLQAEAKLTNVTISGNRALDDGGGIFVTSDGVVSLASTTVSGNQASISGSGGGIYVATQDSESGMATVRNSIVDGNFDPGSMVSGVAPDCFGELNSEGYNLIGSLGTSLSGAPCSVAGDATGNQIGADALLRPLADYGGPTPTHALMPGSPAINAGDPAGCTDPAGGPLPEDQRHGPRVDRCDIGAYEFDALPLFADSFEEPIAGMAQRQR